MAYSLLENFDDIIKQHIAPYLKKHGFKKQNLNFYKTEGDVKFMFNFQKNKYNSVDWVGFFINCGIYSQTVIHTIGENVLPNPKEYECLYQNRINHLSGSNNKEFELLSNHEQHKTEIANKVINELEKAISFYNNIKSNDDLVDLCIQEMTYFWRELFAYLAIQKDETRIKKYAQQYSIIFKEDGRKQFFEDEINKILTKYQVSSIKFETE
ncbi:MAG: hypothetical protein RL757_2094 [Bacteroidota bacterium]|jgi:hypothetical protein